MYIIHTQRERERKNTINTWHASPSTATYIPTYVGLYQAFGRLRFNVATNVRLAEPSGVTASAAEFHGELNSNPDTVL
jgi:hypothetical protein